MPTFAPGVVALGKSVPLGSSATDTPVVVFGPGYRKLFIYHYIAGYTSGGSIALLRFGTASTPDTGANYSSWTSHFATTSVSGTSRVSQTGLQVANDATINGRRGVHEVWNPDTDPKMCDSRTNTFSAQNPTTAAAAQSTQSFCTGHWWNNAQAQCVVMNGGGVSLLAGSFIDVYGLPG